MKIYGKYSVGIITVIKVFGFPIYFRIGPNWSFLGLIENHVEELQSTRD